MDLTGLANPEIEVVDDSERLIVTPEEAQAAEFLARSTAVEMGINYDHLAEPERQLLILATKDQLISQPGDKRIPETRAYTDKDFDTVPLPIEEWLESKYHIGKWYYENIFPAWKDEIIEVINKDAIEWIVTGSIGSGKCCREGTLVPTDRGWVAIEDIVARFDSSPIYVQSESGLKRVTSVHDEGVTETRRVVTKHGHTIEGRSNHRLRVLGEDLELGWKTMGELVEGDVLVQATSEGPEESVLSEAAAELLGWYIAEGNREEGSPKAGINTARFNLHPSELEYVVRLANQAADVLGGYTVKCSESHRYVSITGARVREFFPVETSRNKRVPPHVLAGSRKIVCAFLRGLFSGDGYAGESECSLVTTSPGLAQDVRVLLTGLGLYCSVVKSIASYRLDGERIETGEKSQISIIGPVSVGMFALDIGFAQENKQKSVEEFANRFSSNSDHSFSFAVSAQQLALLRSLQPSHSKQNPHPQGLVKTRTPRGLLHRLKTQRCTVRLLREIAAAGGALPAVLARLVSGEYLFDTVERVEHAKAHCFDLTVEDDPSYVSDGFISHNTTAAILANLYKLYVVTCMKDPCSFYSSTTVTFGMFSVAKYLAQDVEANMLITRIMESEYFRNQVGMEKEVDNPRFAKTAALSFPKKIRFTFGSLARHGLGQDIFGGIMDEVAFDDTPDAQKIRSLYAAVKTRIESRFMTGGGRVPGLLCVVSSANHEGDFLDDHLKNSQLADKVHISAKNVYQVKSFPGARFRVLVGDKLHASRLLDEVYKDEHGIKKVRPLNKDEILPDGVRIEMVPVHWYDRYVLDIEQSLRDISGVALFSTSPFIPNRERLYELVDKERIHPFTIPEPVIDLRDDDLTLESIFMKEELFVEVDRFRNQWRPKINPGAPRFIHADLAKTQDCVGLCCVHLYGFKNVTHVDNQGKEQSIQTPVVYVDFSLKIKPPIGSQIDFTKIQSFIMYLRHIGMPVAEVTFDQYQSTHFQQLLIKAGIDSREISMDKSPAPYMALKQAIMAGCVLYYGYVPLLDELAQLQALYKTPRGEQTSSKLRIDHPPKGGKDCADSLAGAHKACIESKYTAMSMSESEPVVDMKPARPKQGPNPGDATGSSWVYGDNVDSAHITGVYER